MPPPRITLVELARQLGLSKTTVSDALQGRGRVSEETHRRVTEAAARLGYVSNRAARQLRGSALGVFGLYIPPVVRNFSFYMEFAFGAAHGAAESDVDLVLFARDPGLSTTRPFQVDGVIVVDPLPDDPIMARIISAELPVITAGRHRRSTGLAVAGIIEAPHRELVRQVLDRFSENGAKRPALLSSDLQFFSSWADDVVNAYTEWCLDRNVEPCIEEISVASDNGRLRDAVLRITSAPGVDALLCGPQGFGARALAVLRAERDPLPRSFQIGSMVGDPATELSNPRLTSVDLAPWAFGYEAAKMLAEVIRTPPATDDQRSPESTAPEHRTHRATIHFADRS